MPATTNFDSILAQRLIQLPGLDDLCVRFIINLPGDSLESVERICFQVEEAQWFYEDFIRPLDPNLPSLSLRNFCLRIFTHCPLLSGFAVDGRHMQAFEEFLTYKKRIPVRGAIMLNEAMDAAVLVKGWKKGANWSFPRGKINKDEDDLICAIREVYEETGFDLEAAGLVPNDRNVKHIEVNMQQQQMRLYVFKNVPMDTYFEPRTRKEISKIQWWRLSELPAFKKKNQNNNNPEATTNANKFYMVAPFLVPLRKWVIEQKKINPARTASNQYQSAGMSHDELFTEEDRGEESATQAPYEVSAPGSTSLEEATEALSRLLKIQPPTQGLQPEAMGAVQLPQPNNSGQALLALLQSKPANTAALNPPLQTPLGQFQNTSSLPNPPHHQRPHPPRFSEMPPAPIFPIQPQDNAFSYQVPNFHRPHPEQMIQIQPQMQHPRPFQNPHSHQSQHLIHPQPLPPHVQQGVFTGGAIHSPVQLPPTQHHESFQSSHHSVHMGGPIIPQFPNSNAPIARPVQRENPPKLTGHSLALLNAFKGPSQGFNGPKSEEPSIPPFASNSGLQTHQPHPQELPADLLIPKAQSGFTSQMGSQPHSNHLPPRQQISATQKSTLLDMFKSPSLQEAIPAKTSSATALPISGTPSAVELSAVEPMSSVTTAREVTSTQKHQMLPEMNPETNLPFGAISILARPAEMKERDERPKHTQQTLNKYQNQGSGRKPAASTIGKGKAVQPVNKVFQPQILKRPQPGASNEVEAPSLPSPKLPTMAPEPAPPLAPEQKVLAFPTELASPPGHKQTLLSLFGKPSAIAPLAPSNSLGERVPAMKAIDITARSRVGSITSADAAPRRGSQTPISSADKGFLLSYLDSIVG